MAPAITHFLIGASLALVVAAPLAYRHELGPWWPPWLIIGGGVWGLVPDVHHVAPVYEPALRALHDSAWADVFAAHALLDRPVVRERYVESVFAAILCFGAAVVVFTLASWLGSRAERTPVDRHPIAAALALGGLLGVVLVIAAG